MRHGSAQAWAITQGDPDVLVAVIDTGFDWIHPALGGPGPEQSVADSLLYYNDGVIFRNWNEQPGDANGDGHPGIQGVDDDGDGVIDEDSQGLEPGNLPETDMYSGVLTDAGYDTVYDANASWVPNEHVGKYLVGNVEANSIVEVIISNTETSVTSTMDNDLWTVVPEGWAVITYGGTTEYYIANFEDDDDDGVVDDYGYFGDTANDDDENGWNDDMRGWGLRSLRQ